MSLKILSELILGDRRLNILIVINLVNEVKVKILSSYDELCLNLLI